ncbi:hypothetical protein M885DRAFT_598320 [Pelagophyceae sp. CCMP2097]|nr:hypothetical protein M885DRAFT_598320 [Pelagophyceae sp. CCMP2097]
MFPARALFRARSAVSRRAFRTLTKKQLRKLLQQLKIPGRRAAMSKIQRGDLVMQHLSECDADSIRSLLEAWLIKANLLGDQNAELEDSLDHYVFQGKFLLEDLAELVDSNHERNLARHRPEGGGDWDEVIDRAHERNAPPSRLFRGFPDSFQQRPNRKMI